MMPAPASANTVAVTGAVNGACSVSATSAPFQLAVSNQTAPSGSRVVTSAVVASCNGASQISVAATALRLVPKVAPQNSRTQTINYRASVSGWTAAPAAVTTAETQPIVTSPTSFAGSPVQQSVARASATLTITADRFAIVNNPTANGNNGNGGGGNGNGSGSNTKPENGTYSSTITISITPRV